MMGEYRARGHSEPLILQQPGPTTIVFEGRLNKEGNEIALDDLTISWVSKKEEHEDDTLLQVSSESDILTFLDINDTSKTINETVAPAAGKAGEAVHSDNSTWQAPEGTEEDTSTPTLANPEAVTLTPEVTSEILDRGDEVEKTDEVLEPFVTTTAPDSHPSNVTSATPAGEEEGVQGNNTTAHILSEHQDGTSENPDQIQTSVDIVTEVRRVCVCRKCPEHDRQ
ncbi:uncharacterized protein LOC121860673 [Homarus americanus]|uniref:uncharacterized protein LOC121860673 n=1 Tax=Homarus americanus TaxID=6706 RepID=UPI001C4954D3|nr:uncharacterized protein LOC121860673 [Homarus americanus]